MLFFLLALLSVVYSSYIEAKFLRTFTHAELSNYYLCTVSIGSPKEDVYLAVTFSHGHIVLSSQLRNLAYSSSTWLPSGPNGHGFDQVMISGDTFRWPIQHSFETTICGGLCAGEIGLGPTSNLWSIWNSAYFYPTFINLRPNRPDQTRMITSFSFKRATQSGVLVNLHQTDVIPVKMVGLGKTRIPGPLFDEVFYRGGNITLAQLQYSINIESMKRRTYRGVTKMAIEPTDSGDVIELGTVLFDEYNLYINKYDDEIQMYLSTGDSSGRTIRPWHTVFVIIFWFIFLYWAMVDISFLYDYQDKYSFSKLTSLKRKINNEEKVYWLTKGSHIAVISFEIVATAVVYFVNGPPTYKAEVDYFLSISFWISWAVMFFTSSYTWLNSQWMGNYDPWILHFTIWLRASANLSLLAIIIILLLNGTNIDVGMGIIITVFQIALLYTFIRTPISFMIMFSIIPSAEAMIELCISFVWCAIAIWIGWQFSFNSFLVFISDALSVNVNLISAIVVVAIVGFVSYFHRLFLLANIYNRLYLSVQKSNKPKTK